MEWFTLLLEHLAWIEHQFLSGIRDSRKAGSLWGMMRGKEINTPELICQRVRVRDSVGRGQYSSNRISTMHQSTTPSLSQTLGPRWVSRQFVTLPIVQNLLPMTFGYSLSSEAVVMRQLRRWKRLWRRSLTRSHKRTSMGPFRSCCNGTTSGLQSVEITFMCVRSIKVAIRKKYGNLFNDPRIYIYI